MAKIFPNLYLLLFSTIPILTMLPVFHGFDGLDHKPDVALFVFGDSIFDAGNNNYINTTPNFQANFPPFGTTFFKHATGRFSDGRLIPDFIAEYANLPLIPAFFDGEHKDKWAYGVNLASGGGGALVETHAGFALDLKTQLSHFETVEKELSLKLGKKQAKQLLSNSVYLFSVGNNDLLVFSPAVSSWSAEYYTEIVIGNVTDVITELYKKGGRMFGFISIIPLGCLPYARAFKGVNGQCSEEMLSMIKLYNEAFSQRLKQLEKQLDGFQYSIFDSFTALMEMIENPSKYGFKEGKSGCCGRGPFRGIPESCGTQGGEEYEMCDDPREYLFFDSMHASEKAHRLMAEQMWHGGPNVVSPSNLKSFFERQGEGSGQAKDEL